MSAVTLKINKTAPKPTKQSTPTKLKIVQSATPTKLKIVQPVTPTKLKIVQPSPSSNPVEKDAQLMTQSDYSSFEDQKDHVYNIPDTYIGSSVQGDREERVLDLETLLFKKSTIRIPEGVERLFIEILSNAGDNSARSMFAGIDPGEISVTMTDTTIKVRN